MFSFIRHFKEKRENRERILALDLIRGTFLIEIVCAHIAWRPSLITFITGGDQLFASAAEGFFTISGLLVGYLYGPRILKDHGKTAKKIWKRALLLYCLATFYTLFYTAWAVLEPHSAVYQTLYTRGPARFLVDTFTLRYAFGWAEFLTRYALFMLAAPLAVWLIAKGRGWVVAVASFLVWFFLRDVVRFQPFAAWQLPFMFGMIFGYYLPHIESWFHSLSQTARRSIFVSVVGIGFLTYLFSMFLCVAAPLAMPANTALASLHTHLMAYFDKNTLAPARIAIGALWFAAIYLAYRTYEKQISRFTHGVLEVFGRQSLFVYTFHAFILFILYLYFNPPVGHTIPANTLVTFAVLAIIYVAAYYRGHLTKFSKQLFRNRTTTRVP